MKRYGIILFFLTLTASLHSQYQTKLTTSNLNLREDPWIDDNIVCVIPKATSLVIDYTKQEFTDWIRVTYNGNVGYVYSKYLTSIQLKNVFKNQYQFSSNNTHAKYYTNSEGSRVQSPTFYSTQPVGATAVCRDGTYSFSRNRRGTCSHHGGVARWL